MLDFIWLGASSVSVSELGQIKTDIFQRKFIILKPK